MDLINEAIIGDEARKFVGSELGKAMLDRADSALKAAQESLETVDPEDPKAVRALQNKAQLARNFGEWLSELIDSGDNAMIAYKQQEE